MPDEAPQSLGPRTFYRVEPEPEGGPCKATRGDGSELPHVAVHSPDGFQYGYAGSGPADLALSILCDYLQVPEEARNFKGYAADMKGNAPTAWRLHQDFKRDFLQDADATRPLVIRAPAIGDWLTLKLAEDN